MCYLKNKNGKSEICYYLDYYLYIYLYTSIVKYSLVAKNVKLITNNFNLIRLERIVKKLKYLCYKQIELTYPLYKG